MPTLTKPKNQAPFLFDRLTWQEFKTVEELLDRPGYRLVAAGHAIGNHTWHHWYRSMDADTAAKEIEDTAALTYRITGVKTQLFRPPGGFLNNGVAAYAKKQNYAVIMWSVSSADTDWKAAPEAFANNVLKGAKPGAIVLMHDGGGNHQKTVQALPAIIAGLKQQGYRFVTVPELLKMSELSTR
jgi:peptidoglycan/xylan/chitin deacetylase (PgdA/CDA1 family)